MAPAESGKLERPTDRPTIVEHSVILPLQWQQQRRQQEQRGDSTCRKRLRVTIKVPGNERISSFMNRQKIFISFKVFLEEKREGERKREALYQIFRVYSGHDIFLNSPPWKFSPFVCKFAREFLPPRKTWRYVIVRYSVLFPFAALLSNWRARFSNLLGVTTTPRGPKQA